VLKADLSRQKEYQLTLKQIMEISNSEEQKERSLKKNAWSSGRYLKHHQINLYCMMRVPKGEE
jgi:hypothetical protein